MSVFWDKVIDIPKGKGFRINHSSGNTVFYVPETHYDSKAHYSRDSRKSIGYVCSSDTTKMHPNSNFKALFPALWESTFNETAIQPSKRIGMIALCQAVNRKCGVADALIEAVGPERASGILDFALYSILYHSACASQFQAKMKNQALYNDHAMSDSYFSKLFETYLNSDDILNFKRLWVKKCFKEGVRDVWLCIDGSNGDCTSIGVELAEKGHAKSGKNVNIVSYTYAVTQDGLPVTFDVYRGGLVDAKALKLNIDFLSSCGITVKGVILDRGYCDGASLRYLNDNGLSYLIMIKGKPGGFLDTYAECSKTIRMNTEWLVEGTTLFAMQKRYPLFDNYPKVDTITLFYDFKNGDERIESLLNKIYKELDRIREGEKKGENVPIGDEFFKYFNVKRNGKQREVTLDRKKLQRAIDEKGFYGIACSEDMSPLEVYRFYASRNASEKQFMIVKSQLGYNTLGAEKTAGVYAKLTTAFVASLIRYEIECVAKKIGRPTNSLIDEMNLIEIVDRNGEYALTHTENHRQEQLLRLLGTDISILDEMVKNENIRLKGYISSPRYRKPGRKSKRSTGVQSQEAEKRKPGPPVGYKRGDTNKDGSPRKKPGTKPGTKLGEYTKDGKPRQKPGPKPGSHNTRTTGRESGDKMNN